MSEARRADRRRQGRRTHDPDCGGADAGEDHRQETSLADHGAAFELVLGAFGGGVGRTVGLGRVACERDGRRSARGSFQSLPQLLREERGVWVKPPERRLDAVSERAPRFGLLRLGTAPEDRLGELEIPVAKLVPREVVQCLCDQIEAVAGEVLVHGGDRRA